MAKPLSGKPLAEALNAIGRDLIFALQASAIGALNGLTVAEASAAIVKIDLAAAMGPYLDNLACAYRHRTVLGAAAGAMPIDHKRYACY